VRRKGPVTPKLQTEIVPYNKENQESYLVKLCAGGGHSKAVKPAKAKLIGISGNVMVFWPVRSNQLQHANCPNMHPALHSAPCTNMLPADSMLRLIYS
jgi:hypothetical protein